MLTEKNVPTHATVITIHNSAIMCADAYQSQLQRTPQPTTQKILSKHVFLLLTPALIVQVGILYLDNDDEDNEKESLLLEICSLSRITGET